MNHLRDVRAGRVLGRLECIFRWHVLEFDCFLGKKRRFSDLSALAMLGAPLLALHCIAGLPTAA